MCKVCLSFIDGIELRNAVAEAREAVEELGISPGMAVFFTKHDGRRTCGETRPPNEAVMNYIAAKANQKKFHERVCHALWKNKVPDAIDRLFGRVSPTQRYDEVIND